jgi:Na+/H+ antiporter NhaD/arsenite permease-like protein
LSPEASLWITTILFTLTYAGLALGKVPGLRMDRAGIALVGATALMACGLLSLEQAVQPESIDYRTLALLFGMMIVIAYLQISGFFVHLAAWALRRIRTPDGLLAATIVLSGVLSAFLINDVVCITLTPLVLHLARRLKFEPVPHLIALATAATITGNPQNIFIGSHSGIPYLRFVLRLAPVAAVGLMLNYLIVRVVYRHCLRAQSAEGASRPGVSPTEEDAQDTDVPNGRAHVWLRRKSVAVTLVVVGLFFTGLPLELVALGGAAVLLLGRVRPAKVYSRVDWGLLVMFTGLFIVVHAFRLHVVSRWGIEHWHWLLSRPVDLLSLVSAGLSNLVSNVPAVLLLEPVVQAMPAAQHETAWLALAMSSTLAGNLTVLGSVANLIVVEKAGREGVTVSFWEYCKVGIPLTLLTLLTGIAWLQLVRY